MIKIENLTTQKESQIILDDINLEVPQGSFVSIVGLSGAGKTTLLRCMLGLDSSFTGDISIYGQKHTDYLQEHTIAFVSQKYSNYPWLTVWENLRLARQDVTDKEITETLKRLGLLNHKDSYPMQLSGGMQQRVALGRALLQNTDIIFFDEPFSALDIQTRSQMQELLLDLWHEEHKTIVFVTHDIDEAVYLSETIYVLGSHPARIEQRVDVDLARPRIADMRFTQEFTKIKKSIIYALRTATIQTKLQHSLQGGGHTLGLFVWSGNSPWYYAYEKGQIDDELSLVSIESNTNGLEKLLKGELSMLNVTLDFAVKAIEQNPSLEIVMPLNYSTGGDALVLGSHLNAVHQLSGKRIGIERHAVSHFFLMYLLDKHGIDPNTIQEINMLGGDIGAALIRGDIDAGVLWEPWLSQARDLSEGVIAESTEQLENQILHDVIIAPRTFIQDNQNLIQNMRESWDTAIDEIHSDQAIKTVSSLLGISHTDVRRSLEGITFVPHTSNLFVDAMKKIKEFYKK